MFLYIPILIKATDQIKWGVVNGFAQLPCYTEYAVSWIKVLPSNQYTYIINRNRPTSAYSSRAALSLLEYYKNLTLTNLTFDDAGNYRCIEHMAIPVTKNPTVILTIVDPMNINVSINAFVGDNIELPCAFESAMWSMCTNNTLIPVSYDTTNKLKIYNVSQSNSGVYYCFKNMLSYSIKLAVSPIRTTINNCISSQFITVNVNIYYAIITILVISTLLSTSILAVVFCKRKPYIAIPKNT